MYRDDVVYVGGAATDPAVYYDQAEVLATAALDDEDPNAEKREWLPLGVFAYAKEGVTETDTYLQLAVTRDGIIGGTHFNQATGVSRPLKGTVDKKTQRAAWTFADGKNTDAVMETGIYNLTKDEVPVLVHFGPGKTQEGMLLRVEPPKDSDANASPVPAPKTDDEKAGRLYKMARNYLAAGMKANAIEYADKIVKEYPGSEWATKASKLLTGAASRD